MKTFSQNECMFMTERFSRMLYESTNGLCIQEDLIDLVDFFSNLSTKNMSELDKKKYKERIINISKGT